MSHSEKDLTKGPIFSQLWSLAWPMMLSMFFYTLYGIVDTFWVGKLSVESIAAVSISQIVLFIMISLSMGIAVGSGVVMAMRIGAKDDLGAERTLAQSFALAGVASLFFTTICFVFQHSLLTLSGAVGAIYDPAKVYFSITAGGSILFFLLMNVMFAFNAEGDTFTLTKLFAVSTFINIVLDPLMIFGYGFIPALGIAGAAYATLISQAVFVASGLYVLSRPSRRTRFNWRYVGIRWQSAREVLRIGIPASLTQVINPVGLAVLVSLVSRTFLEAGATAFSLVFRLEFFAYLPAAGFGMAAMAMMSQSMGAGNMQRADEVFKKAVLVGFLSATGLGLLMVVLGRYIIGAFTADPTVIAYATQYLFIVAVTYGCLAVGMIVASSFQAIGRSWPGFWLFFLKFFVLSIPLAYLAVRYFPGNIQPIWWAIAIGNVVLAAAGYSWKSRTQKPSLVQAEATASA